MGSYGSTSIERVTAVAGDTLTAALVLGSVAAGVRVDSHSQFQVFLDYTPHASNTTSSTYAEVELVYTEQPADTADQSGGSGTITWKSYVVESTVSATAPLMVSEFLIKRWRMYADDTANKDRSPTFSVPLGAKRVNLKMLETGAGGNFGTLIGKIGHQCI